MYMMLATGLYNDCSNIARQLSAAISRAAAPRGAASIRPHLRTHVAFLRGSPRSREAMFVCSGPGRLVAGRMFLSDLGCFGFLASRLDLFCPFDIAISPFLVPCCELALVNHPLLAVRIIFDPILRRIAIHRKQTNDRVATFTSVINSPAGGKVHYLTHTEFVL